jgi:hypothetical protein
VTEGEFTRVATEEITVLPWPAHYLRKAARIDSRVTLETKKAFESVPMKIIIDEASSFRILP